MIFYSYKLGLLYRTNARRKEREISLLQEIVLKYLFSHNANLDKLNRKSNSEGEVRVV